MKKAAAGNGFTDWIDALGFERVGKLMNVHPTTVRYWRSRQNWPRVHQMRRIRKVSKGLVTYEMIIDGTPGV